MHFSDDVLQAIDNSFEADRAGYDTLSPAQKNFVTKTGAIAFSIRRRTGMAGHNTLRKIEQVMGRGINAALWLGDKVLFAPYRFLARHAEQIGLAATRGLIATARGALRATGAALGGIDRALGFSETFLSGRKNTEKLIAAIARLRRNITYSRRVLKIVSRNVKYRLLDGWAYTRIAGTRAIAALKDGYAWSARNVLFKPFIALSNPRLPDGRPLFINERVQKAAGFALAAASLAVAAGVLGYVEVKGLQFEKLVIEGISASGGSYIGGLALLGVAHIGLSAGLAATKLLILPAVAAARRGLKNNALTQGIAYQYTRRLRAAQANDARADARETVPPAKPLRFVEGIVGHIVQGTRPEIYEVDARAHFTAAASGAPTPETKPAAKPDAPKGPRP